MKFTTLSETLSRQKLVVVAVFIVGFAAFLWAQGALKQYTATSTVLATSASGQDSAVLDPRKDPTSAAVTPHDLPNLLASSTVVDRVAADLHLGSNKVASLAKNVTARNPLASDVIPIAFTDRDPALAVAGANAFTRELVRYVQQISTSRYDALIADLEHQLDGRRTALDKVDAQIASIMASDPYVTPETGTTALDTRLTQLEQQRQTVEASVRGDEAAASEMAKRPALARALASHEIIASDPAFVAMRGQYGKDLATYNVTKAGYTDSFPGLKGEQDQVDRERASLTAEENKATADPGKSPAYVAALLDANKARAQLASDRAQLASIDREVGTTTSRLASSQGENGTIASLRRARAAEEAAYASLSERRSKAVGDRTQAMSVDSVVVIDRATGAQRSLLSRPTVLGFGIALISLWLAITLAFLFDGADRRLGSPEAIADLYGRPVLTPVG